MATVTYIREKKQSFSAMKGVIDYCKQECKTHDSVSGRDLVSGVNCNGMNALTEFMLTKKSFRKPDGTTFYHYVQSFMTWDEVSAIEAHEIALEFAARAWPGHEVLVCTHCDTDNPHSHFVINSVNYKNGYKLRQSPNTLHELRALSDEICIAHGLAVIEEPSDTKLSSREFRAALKKESWKFQLMALINETMKHVGSREEFIHTLNCQGYEVSWTPERKYITFQCPNGKKCRDIKLHDKKFEKENLELEFTIRKQTAEEFLVGWSGRREHRKYGADQAYTLSADPLRDPEGSERSGISIAAAGGKFPAGAVSDDRSAGDQGRAAELRQGDAEHPDEVYGSDSQRADGRQRSGSGQDAAYGRTGWEDTREIYFRQFFCSGIIRTGAEPRDRWTAAEDHSDPNLLSGLGGHAVGYGVGGLVAAAGLMEDNSEDAEDRHRKYEAEQAAKNLGAVLGLTAGVLLAAQNNTAVQEELKPEEQEEQFTMKGL